ncbi:glycosyltransferase [Novosphingobium sp. KACC 22771]|uniref:glycosyltransferase n=1 Tax=Novosphingobium sp. KACC 22771 TaxID=3025670 RepID=UPI002365D5A8|nr:glycosyltransferase [Novosphingobium sp. KACC 22771]WDF72855.1 glycosyltransferase [Novosphingobium sp. KACC 22771]
MGKARPKRLALVWSQFAAYHVDRCEALAALTAGKVDIYAVEVATSSHLYAWEPSGAIRGTKKITLFHGKKFEEIAPLHRFLKLFVQLVKCDQVFWGIGYHEPEIIPLIWLLRLFGVKAYLMMDSKYDDSPRQNWFEFLKSIGLSAYSGALVAGHRHRQYVEFLSFRNRPVLLGYDCVAMARFQKFNVEDSNKVDWQDRDFLFVGRFVAKKNILKLIDAFNMYCEYAKEDARRLILVGDGPQRPEIMRKIVDLGLHGQVIMTGFLPSDEVAKAMGISLALLLVSYEEQWGLVINEAVALGLPVIASANCGSTDLLVRNLVNGLVVEPRSVEAICAAMVRMAGSEEEWQAMSKASSRFEQFADVSFFANSVIELAKIE